MSKFNFQIIYRFEIQDIKFDNLTRRSENLSKNVTDERTQHNHQMLLKDKNLSVEVRNVIELISDLMNERQMNVAKITTMMYDLIEENVLDDEKSIEESSSNILETDLMNEKSVEESNTEQFINLSNIMKRIKATYFDDDVLQQLMNAKRTEKRKISFNFYKKNIKLKLKDCKIQNDFF